MKSRLADQARQEQLDQVRRMTPEQRLQAFMRHSQLVTQLYLAGQAAAEAQVLPERTDAS
ncbi:MAG: hypothetical protein ACHQIL_05855 [Steroidobacterales bacterium]